MATELATEKGEVINALISHHRARDPDRGNGMVIVGHSYISDEGKRSKNQLGIHRDEFIPGLRKLAKAIRDEGAVAIIQLNHARAKAPPEIIGKRPVGPSSVPVPGGEVPRELSVAEIEEMIKKLVEASRRAMEAGFDGVEMHGAHDFLLSQFLSPLTNVRADEYGGKLENRMRLHLRIVSSIRKEVKGLLLFRLGVTDHMERGLTVDEGVKVAMSLEKSGVDIINVSGGLCGSRPPWIIGEGYFLGLSESVRKRVKVPVIGVGGIKSPLFADKTIREGKVDLIAVGRAFLTDPDWALRAIELLGKSGHG